MLVPTLRAPHVTLATVACSALLAAACASRPSSSISTAPAPAGSPRLTVRGDSTLTPGQVAIGAVAAPVAEPTPRALVLSAADEVVGTRYRYGGTSPKRGFDCSGFVRWVYAQQGIDLPRTARGMARAGTRVPARRTELAPGDLLLFAAGGRVTHVAIYVGDGRIIHASSGQGAVRYDDLDSARGRWFRRHVVSARRVLAERDADCLTTGCRESATTR